MAHQCSGHNLTRLASSQWTRAWRHAFPFLFTTRYPIRQKVPWENGNYFEWWGFEITELRSSNGKTTGNRFDLEIAGLLRLNLVRNIEGPLCSEIPCLVAPRVARCLGTWSCFLCLSNDCDSSSIRAIFSHINITGRAIPIYRSDYLPTITSPWVTQKLKISKRRIEPRSLKELC